MKLKTAEAIQLYANEITPKIDTAYQGIGYTPKNGEPYQEYYILPAMNEAPYINQSDIIYRGIFQITLKYPSGNGIREVLERIDVIEPHFFKGKSIEHSGVKVVFDDSKTINLGTDGDRIIYAFRVDFRAFKIAV